MGYSGRYLELRLSCTCVAVWHGNIADSFGLNFIISCVDQIVEWTTGRSLFQYDTKTGNPQQILGHMVRALGHFPPELIAKGRFASKWFNADGQ